MLLWHNLKKKIKKDVFWPLPVDLLNHVRNSHDLSSDTGTELNTKYFAGERAGKVMTPTRLSPYVQD